MTVARVARPGPTSPSATSFPALVLVMTATRIVAGAIATRDFMPVHHDRDYANAQGAPDIFMNILSDNGVLQPVAHRLGRPRRDGQAPRDPPRRAG